MRKIENDCFVFELFFVNKLQTDYKPKRLDLCDVSSSYRLLTYIRCFAKNIFVSVIFQPYKKYRAPNSWGTGISIDIDQQESLDFGQSFHQ